MTSPSDGADSGAASVVLDVSGPAGESEAVGESEVVVGAVVGGASLGDTTVIGAAEITVPVNVLRGGVLEASALETAVLCGAGEEEGVVIPDAAQADSTVTRRAARAARGR